MFFNVGFRNERGKPFTAFLLNAVPKWVEEETYFDDQRVDMSLFFIRLCSFNNGLKTFRSFQSEFHFVAFFSVM